MQKDDVLRLLRDPSLLPSEQQVLLSDIAGQAASLKMSCYLVGGVVRDLFMNQPVNDLDIIVEGDAIHFGKTLVKKFGGKLTPHEKFHTAIWKLPESLKLRTNTLDLITARKETYANQGALPTVTPASIEEDLRRRDFTINAMAIRIDRDHFGEFFDPLNGNADLEDRILRVLHARSFLDDPTRIFRAIRYEHRYSFNLEPSTLKLINPESLTVLETVSGERIRHELDLIWEEENSFGMIQRARTLGVFQHIHPQLPGFNQDYAQYLAIDSAIDIPVSRVATGYMLWLMDLPEAEILSISKRLDFTTDLTHSVWAVSQLKKSLPFLAGANPSIWTFALEKLPLHAIYVVYLISREKALLDYLSLWRHVKPHTTGDDLIAQGLQPGPRFGEILTALRAAWLDGEIANASQEKEFLSKIL